MLYMGWQYKHENHIFFPTLFTRIENWDAWLSKISKTGYSLQGLQHAINYFKLSIKRLSFDQIAGYEPATEAVGAAVNMQFFKCTVEKINIGGMWLPMAFTATIIVTFIPVSSEVILLIIFISSEHILLEGTRTVELPTSSKLQSLIEVKPCLDISVFKFGKNACTYLIKTCRSSATSSFGISHTQGLYILWTTYCLYQTLWHNYTIFFAILKGNFQSLLLCYTV